jgi:hypothetical protein
MAHMERSDTIMETNSGLNIFEILETPIGVIFPTEIIDHALYGFILEATVFLMAWGFLIAISYVPFLISYRLIMKGVKRWF